MRKIIIFVFLSFYLYAAGIKAGEDFNISINAVGYDNKPAKDYNETNGDSFIFKVNEVKSICIQGKLSNIPNPLKFKDGNITFLTKYSEVGELNLTIKEQKGKEFAKVDADDTPDSKRLIEENYTVVMFVPDHFNITGNYQNFNGSSFTYISNDLNMSSILNLTITAENSDNNPTLNYNSQCYAKDFDVNISYNKLSSKLSTILIKEKNSKEQNITLPNVITSHFSKDYFSTTNKGSANLVFYINFEKNYTTPVNEFNFTIKDINVSDKDTFGNNNLNKTATFRYGRIEVQNISGYGNMLNTIFRYEYWNDKEGWIINKDHNLNFGNINITKSYIPKDVFLNVNSFKNGEENITILTTHSLPYSVKIHLSIPSYLWYHPLAKPYKDPKTSSGWNLDCLTHPCFNVQFLSSNNTIGWGGVGENNSSKYSASIRTPDINSTFSKIKANKTEVKKFNW